MQVLEVLRWRSILVVKYEWLIIGAISGLRISLFLIELLFQTTVINKN